MYKQVIHIKGTLAVEHTNHLRLSCFSSFKLRFYHFTTFNKEIPFIYLIKWGSTVSAELDLVLFLFLMNDRPYLVHGANLCTVAVIFLEKKIKNTCRNWKLVFEINFYICCEV